MDSNLMNIPSYFDASIDTTFEYSVTKGFRPKEFNKKKSRRKTARKSKRTNRK